jgi:hypothetical protein
MPARAAHQTARRLAKRNAPCDGLSKGAEPLCAPHRGATATATLRDGGRPPNQAATTPSCTSLSTNLRQGIASSIGAGEHVSVMARQSVLLHHCSFSLIYFLGFWLARLRWRLVSRRQPRGRDVALRQRQASHAFPNQFEISVLCYVLVGLVRVTKKAGFSLSSRSGYSSPTLHTCLCPHDLELWAAARPALHYWHLILFYWHPHLVLDVGVFAIRARTGPRSERHDS